MHKLFGGSLLPWVAFLQEHRGLDYNLFLSKQAFTDLEDPSVVPPGAKPYIRGERTCPSIAIIELLVFLAVHRRADDEKKLAELFTTGLLHRMLTAEEAATVAKLTESAEGHEACACGVADGVCCNTRGVCMLLPGARPDPRKQLMEVLLVLFKGISCPVVLLWYLALSKTVAKLLIENALTADSDLDPTRYKALPGNAKRVRIDEGLKLHVLKVVQEGRAATCSALLTAQGEDELVATAARKWESLGCQRWLLAMRRTWVQLGTLSLAPDASRFGCPAEEAVAYSTWHTRSQIGGRLPCQATLCKYIVFCDNQHGHYRALLRVRSFSSGDSDVLIMLCLPPPNMLFLEPC